jgi:hypothetical protein
MIEDYKGLEGPGLRLLSGDFPPESVYHMATYCLDSLVLDSSCTFESRRPYKNSYCRFSTAYVGTSQSEACSFPRIGCA